MSCEGTPVLNVFLVKIFLVFFAKIFLCLLKIFLYSTALVSAVHRLLIVRFWLLGFLPFVLDVRDARCGFLFYFFLALVFLALIFLALVFLALFFATLFFPFDTCVFGTRFCDAFFFPFDTCVFDSVFLRRLFFFCFLPFAFFRLCF